MKKIYLGIDVSKKKLDLCWLRNVEQEKVKTKVFANTSEGHTQLLQWIEKTAKVELSNCVIMLEATGVYHEQVTYRLRESKIEVRLTQPQQFYHFVASFGVRSKTDKTDSKRLAQYAAAGNGRVWVPEPVETRCFKALLTRVESLSEDIMREENRLESATIAQISDVVIQSIEDVIVLLKKEKIRLEQEMDQHEDKHPDLKNDIELLKTIPGIGPVVSRYMACLIRSKPFEKATQCAAFVGLNPVVRESGSSLRGRARLSKAGCSRIRAKLYMAAIVAIRYNPIAKDLYDRLVKKGKAKMSALGAVMRKLVHICFGVLKHQKKFCSTAISA